MTAIDAIIEFLKANDVLLGALAALATFLGALAAVFLKIWLPTLAALARWRLARQIRSDQQRRQTAA